MIPVSSSVTSQRQPGEAITINCEVIVGDPLLGDQHSLNLSLVNFVARYPRVNISIGTEIKVKKELQLYFLTF